MRKEELENELHILEESSEGGIILKKRYEYFWRNCWPCRSKTAMDRSWWCMVWMIRTAVDGIGCVLEYTGYANLQPGNVCRKY